MIAKVIWIAVGRAEQGQEQEDMILSGMAFAFVNQSLKVKYLCEIFLVKTNLFGVFKWRDFSLFLGRLEGRIEC